jgi:tetratricopeptide (TPR) repeat protein
VTRSAARWIDTLGDDRAFLFLHLYDPHDPYEPAPPWGRLPLPPYDAEIAATDRALAEFSRRLASAGILDDALVIALADHGEAFGEHGETGHGFFIYDTTLRIPLVIASPEAFTGGILRSDLARTRDIRSTVLATLGLGAGGLRTRDPAEPERAYAETFEPALRHEASELRSRREGRWKYIRAPREELYDLRADPGETDNRIESETDIVDGLRARMEARLGDELIHPKGLADAERLDDERIAELAALGYVAAGPLADDFRNERDPKDLVGITELLDQAVALERSGDWDGLTALARRIHAIDPRNPTSWRLLAGERLARGTPEEGLAVWQRAVEEVPDSGTLWGAYGADLLRFDRAEEARGALRQAVRLNGGTPAVRLQLAVAALRTGLPRVAWKEVEAVLAADPEHAGALRLAAELDAQGVPRPPTP